MIIEAILGLIHTVAMTVVQGLPQAGTDPTSYSVPTDALATSIVTGLFPWEVALVCAGVMLGWMLVCHGYRIVLWLLGVFHISGDGG